MPTAAKKKTAPAILPNVGIELVRHRSRYGNDEDPPSALGLRLDMPQAARHGGAGNVQVVPYRSRSALLLRLAARVEELSLEKYPRAGWSVEVNTTDEYIRVEMVAGGKSTVEMTQLRCIIEAVLAESGYPRKLSSFWW